MPSKKDAIAAGAFLYYIRKTPYIPVTDAIGQNTRNFHKLLKSIPPKKRKYAYGENKWTIKEVLQHIIDAERVFAYRALRTARLDATAMAGFDENSWAAAANRNNRKWSTLVKEFALVRASTEMLFESFGSEELRFQGMASSHPINALALGYVIAGHVQHHMDIIKERYL